jgi:hypothetical protein
MTLAPELPAITDAGVTSPITAPFIGPVIGPAIGVTGAELDDAGVAWAGHLPEWRLLVAPLGGTFRAVPNPGFADSTPAVVGYVDARSDRRAIIPPWRGPIIEWLVQDGDPVSAGQALARLLPEGTELLPRSSHRQPSVPAGIGQDDRERRRNRASPQAGRWCPDPLVRRIPAG